MPRTIESLPLGAKIRFGSYCVENEGAHSIRWIKMNSYDTVFLTEFIEDFRAFDSREPDNIIQDRRDYGNNRYSVSNIDQFLNSSKENNWYAPQHYTDTPPTNGFVSDRTSYLEHPGFLAYFTKAEIDAIIPIDINVALSDYDKEEQGYEKITRRVFLPSVQNVFGTYRHTVPGDEMWEYFKNESTVSTCTKEAIDNSALGSGKPEPQDDWYYWLRTPKVNSPQCVMYADHQGDYDWFSAYSGLIGIRPALVISPEILVTDEPDEDGYYDTLLSSNESENVSEEDFLSTLLV